MGYDINQIYLASYDWRLSTRNLEERDHFFSRIMSQIEFNSRVYKRKTVLISHSMGGTVAMYLLKWLEHERGAAWIDEHIEALANLSGTLLGVPKAMPALMTGEMRDTVQVPSMLAYPLLQCPRTCGAFPDVGGQLEHDCQGRECRMGRCAWRAR